jgi:MSHA biogenesis protein MshK
MAGGMRKIFPACLASALAALSLSIAHAQVLVDPTRPPMSVGRPSEEAPPATQLQSILISGRRRVAVINGNTVALGEMIGEARVVKITETEVVLKTGEETEVLKMYPGIEKQAVKSRSAGRGGSK